MRKLILIAGALVFQFIGVVLIGRAQQQTPPTKPVDLFGKVVAPDGKPVAGAKVSLLEADPQTRAFTVDKTATSDAQGKFQFTAAKPTSLAIVRAEGFAVSGNIMQESSAESPITITMKPPTELKLKFLGPDGNPLAGLKVWPSNIREQSTGPGVNSIANYVMIVDKLKDEFTRTTDAGGVVTFPNMPQGSSFSFEIDDDHFAMASNASAIKLAAAPTTDGGTIKLETGGSIAGQVTSPDGKPVANLYVMATGQSTGADDRIGWGVTAQTDADGKYVLKKARSGNYTLRFELTPELTKQYVAPATDTFTLSAGQELTGKDVKLITGATVSGKVTKAGSTDPIPNVRIIAYTIENGQNGGRINSQSQAATGADGTYTVHVSPGQVQVSMLSPPPAGYVNGPTPNRMTTLADGQTYTADFQLAVDNTPGIKGHVIDETGAPVAGATIVLQAPLSNTPTRVIGGMAQVQTDSQGAFTVPSGVAESSAVRVRKGTMATLAPTYVTAQNRQDLKITMHKDAVASVRVKLVDPAGAPIPDGQLMIQQTSGTDRLMMQGGTTGADGTDVLSSLYLDTNYSVQARAKGFGSGSINLSLRPGATTDASLTMIKADSFVAGMVLDENQLPLADATVTANGPKSEPQSTKTDFTGHFRINNLVPGDTITVYTRVNNRTGAAERVPAGTDNMILVHNPPAPVSRSTSAPARGVGRRGP